LRNRSEMSLTVELSAPEQKQSHHI